VGRGGEARGAQERRERSFLVDGEIGETARSFRSRRGKQTIGAKVYVGSNEGITLHSSGIVGKRRLVF
jgi:hypothetical protein